MDRARPADLGVALDGGDGVERHQKERPDGRAPPEFTEGMGRKLEVIGSSVVQRPRPENGSVPGMQRDACPVPHQRPQCGTEARQPASPVFFRCDPDTHTLYRTEGRNRHDVLGSSGHQSQPPRPHPLQASAQQKPTQEQQGHFPAKVAAQSSSQRKLGTLNADHFLDFDHAVTGGFAVHLRFEVGKQGIPSHARQPSEHSTHSGHPARQMARYGHKRY